MAAAAVSTESGQTSGKRPEPPSLERLAAAFPQLEVIALIGQGGMGAVYKARQKQLDRIVALKVLPPGISGDPSFAERFTREAKALAKLLHPNIVTLFEFGQANGIYYLLMEYVDGVSLGQLLRSSRVSPREALAIVPQICDALQYAHDQGIVHRDIKPENILLDRRGRVKVADFGLAKLVEPNAPLTPSLSPSDGERVADRPGEGKAPVLTGAGKIMGTPNYMAPEQTEHPGEVDHRADIYALGVVFYQMLTGELPGKPIEPPSKKVQVDVRLDEVVLRALEKKPELRYQQASQVKTAVESISAQPSKATEPTAPPSAAWEAARQQVRAPATALLVLGLLGLAISLLVRIRGGGPDSLDMSVGPFMYWRVPMPGGLRVGLLFLNYFFPAFYLVMVLGAARMRRLQDYGLAVAGTVLAMITLTLVPFGLPLGMWALAVLLRKGIRREFGMVASATGRGEGPTGQRLSKPAVTALALALVPMLELPLAALLWRFLGTTTSSGWHSVVSSVAVFLEVWPPVGTLLLGWIALEDIRRAKGQLKGAGPAVFGLLFVPSSWAIRLLTAEGAVENTPVENLAFALTANILALLICGGLALWVHKHEVRRSHAGRPGAYSGWWFFSRPTAWFIRAFACGVFGLYLASAVRPWLRQIQQPTMADEEAFLSHVHGEAPLAARGATNQFVVRLDAGEAEFLAVSDVSRGSPICWRLDGTQLCGPTQNPGQAAGGSRKAHSLVLTFGLDGATEGVLNLPLELRIAGKAVASPSGFSTRGRQYVLFSAAQDARLLDVRVGKPVGEWQDTYAGWEWNGKMPRRPERVISHAGQEVGVALNQVREGSGVGASAAWFSRSFPADWVGRLVAVDDAGVVHQPAVDLPPLRNLVNTGDWWQQETFKGLAASHIKELRFQIRQCRWIEVRNISLQPGLQTQVEIVDIGDK